MARKATAAAQAPFGVHLSVLAYREEGEWVALALDMDIRGYGPTFEDAISDLRDLVHAQVSFAAFKNQPEMIFHPAEPIWFERFAEARREAIASLAGKPLADEPFRAGSIPFPTARALTASSRRFAKNA